MQLYQITNQEVRIKVKGTFITALALVPVSQPREQKCLHSQFVVVTVGEFPSNGDVILEWNQEQVWVDAGETPYPGRVLGRIIKKQGNWAPDDRVCRNKLSIDNSCFLIYN